MSYHRRPVSKGHSASKFRGQAARVHPVNLKPGLARGGIRL